MGDFNLPPDYPTVPAAVYDDVKLVKLAREIAMGLKDIPDILFDNGLTQREFEEFQQLPYFNKLVAAELGAWGSAGNVLDRVKLKSGAMIEELLPEIYARLNDAKEPLMAKVKLMEVASKWAGFGDRDITPAGAPGDRVQVIINLGADHRLEYQKTLPPKVIDHEASVPLETSFENSIQASIDASPYPV